MTWSKIAQDGTFGYYATNTMDGLAYRFYFVWKTSGWLHVRCWCGSREDENAGEASPYLEIWGINIPLNCMKIQWLVATQFYWPTKNKRIDWMSLWCHKNWKQKIKMTLFNYLWLNNQNFDISMEIIVLISSRQHVAGQKNHAGCSSVTPDFEQLTRLPSVLAFLKFNPSSAAKASCNCIAWHSH